MDWVNFIDHCAEKVPIFPFLASVMVSFLAQNARENMASEQRASERICLKILNTASERREGNSNNWRARARSRLISQHFQNTGCPLRSLRSTARRILNPAGQCSEKLSRSRSRAGSLTHSPSLTPHDFRNTAAGRKTRKDKLNK